MATLTVQHKQRTGLTVDADIIPATDLPSERVLLQHVLFQAIADTRSKDPTVRTHALAWQAALDTAPGGKVTVGPSAGTVC